MVKKTLRIVRRTSNYICIYVCTLYIFRTRKRVERDRKVYDCAIPCLFLLFFFFFLSSLRSTTKSAHATREKTRGVLLLVWRTEADLPPIPYFPSRPHPLPLPPPGNLQNPWICTREKIFGCTEETRNHAEAFLLSFFIILRVGLGKLLAGSSFLRFSLLFNRVETVIWKFIKFEFMLVL